MGVTCYKLLVKQVTSFAAINARPPKSGQFSPNIESCAHLLHCIVESLKLLNTKHQVDGNCKG